MSRFTAILISSLSIALGALIHTAPVLAQGEGPCSAWINGVPVRGRTISVDRTSAATIKVAAPTGPAQNSVYLEFFNRRWKIASSRSDGGEWSGTVRVQDYARWGVGLYKLVWESRAPDGSIVCKVSSSFRIPGFPLSTAAGATAAASIVLGLTGLTLTLKTTINEGARWAIKVVTKAKVEGDRGRRRLRLKPSISVSQTLLGTLWGLLLSGGTLAMLQETGLSLPTVQLSLQLAIPFTVLSLVASWFRIVRE